MIQPLRGSSVFSATSRGFRYGILHRYQAERFPDQGAELLIIDA
jgi:hypothetical protein